MLNKRVEKALNGQLNAEIAASQRCLAAAAYCHSQQLPGFAAWCQGQAEGSRGAAMYYLQYISERGGRAEITGQEPPAQQFNSINDVIAAAIALEEERARQAEKLHDLALSEGDKPTLLVLEKFVISIGPARIKQLRTLLHQLKMTEGNNAGLIMIDRSLAG